MTSKRHHDVINRSWRQKVRHDVKKFVITPKSVLWCQNTSWRQKVRHGIKIMSKSSSRHQTYVFDVKSGLWRQKDVMTSKSSSWCPKVRNDVKNTSWHHKVRCYKHAILVRLCFKTILAPCRYHTWLPPCQVLQQSVHI